jgi:hypothetical protein
MAVLQEVMLRGGYFDGQLAHAPPTPGALRLEMPDTSYLYVYLVGQSIEHEGRRLSVMVCQQEGPPPSSST